MVTHQQVEARTPNNDALVVLGHNNNGGGALPRGTQGFVGEFQREERSKDLPGNSKVRL